MTTESCKAKDIFIELVGHVVPEEWDERLVEACEGNEDLRRRAQALLRAHSEPSSFLEEPAIAVEESADTESPIAERPGTIIGPYQLVEQIGEGGMGVVFLAEQARPIQRTVALKIIKPGMDTRQVIARFEAERQALAMMDHPNVAKVLDAGTTAPVESGYSGRPYFVMELVKGVPITEYCDAQHLSVSRRLELMAAVCQAVQHAHQKGLIHRDLKPSNVLVADYDGRPVPKIIDFGVAKAIDSRSVERTLCTEHGQIVGTLEYMSPEQAAGSPDIDTRSDVYSLGVLLYELLAGSPPFDAHDLRSKPYGDVQRIIREVDPPAPSTKLSHLDTLPTVAANRESEPRSLYQAVQGELDWIVMKCLEKDRTRRYESAAALAADLGRYQADEPVSAAAASRLYQMSKLFRRNRLAVIASAAVLLGLVAGVIGMAIGLVSLSRERIISERQRAEAQLNLANSLQSQRKYAEAEALYRQGLDLPIDATIEDRRRVARTRLHLAKVVYDRGDAAESERLHRDALAAYRAEFPPGDPNIAHALTTYALLLRAQHRDAEAEPLFREAYDIYRRAVPADQFAIGVSARYLASVLVPLGRHDEAEPVLREGIAAHQRAASPDLWALAIARIEHGRNLMSTGKFTEAEAELIEAQRVLVTTEANRDGIFALAVLYAVWNESEPGKGHDLKAREWFRKLINTFVPLERPPAEPKKAPAN
jgi:serine/threonine protein kinase